MRAYLKELKFDSSIHTYIKNITQEVNDAVKKTKIRNGFVFVSSKHTTLGIIVHEIAEPNLLEDIVNHSLSSIHEDKRSTRVGKDYKHPTKDYKHRCQDNPYCDEIDEDYNAGAHIRALTFSHSSVTIPVRNGKLDLGKYQEVAVFEFDGRDGSGKNPIRKRTVQICIYETEAIKVID
ncbi:MAG: YjbQ family protein [Candidatus Levybacteria bacterium]|nr:YjbQ family protein [Candidatus Levybacteria bacterium]